MKHSGLAGYEPEPADHEVSISIHLMVTKMRKLCEVAAKGVFVKDTDFDS